MKPPLLLALIGAVCFATFGTSCKTIDDPSPFTEKVRENSDIGKIKTREQRRYPH